MSRSRETHVHDVPVKEHNLVAHLQRAHGVKVELPPDKVAEGHEALHRLTRERDDAEVRLAPVPWTTWAPKVRQEQVRADPDVAVSTASPIPPRPDREARRDVAGRRTVEVDVRMRVEVTDDLVERYAEATGRPAVTFEETVEEMLVVAMDRPVPGAHWEPRTVADAVEVRA